MIMAESHKTDKSLTRNKKNKSLIIPTAITTEKLSH